MSHKNMQKKINILKLCLIFLKKSRFAYLSYGMLSCAEIKGGWGREGCFVVKKFYKEEVERRGRGRGRLSVKSYIKY
jgi:hypothetical protein